MTEYLDWENKLVMMELRTGKTTSDDELISRKEPTRDDGPSGLREPKRNVAPYGLREPKRNVAPYGLRESKRNAAPSGLREPKRNAAPSGLREPKRNAAPSGLREPKRNATPYGLRETKRNAAPSGLRETKRNAAPSGLRETKRNAAPYGLREPKRNAAPSGLREPKRNATPSGLRETKRNAAPRGLREPTNDDKPSGDIGAVGGTPASSSTRMLMLSREMRIQKPITVGEAARPRVASNLYGPATQEKISSAYPSARMLMLSGEKRIKKPVTVGGAARPQADNHEVEVIWEGDWDLHARKKKCDKNPGHTEFIPVHEFKEEHLPPRYRDEMFPRLVSCLSELTVHLKVDKISPQRPFPPYPPDPRCDTSTWTGSGHVSHAVENTEKKKTCPCRECVSSNCPKKEWGKIYIHTAAHVVYDDLEAANTTCSFFYNTDNQNIIEKIRSMERVEIDLNEDRCWMFGYTHNMPLLEILCAETKNYEDLQKKIRKNCSVESYNVEDTDHKLTIIVSHPHGCCKYVSVGEFVERRELPDDPDWTQYTYTTPTCPGSSGAPVFILGKQGWFDYHHHSGVAEDKRLNKSTYGLF